MRVLKGNVAKISSQIEKDLRQRNIQLRTQKIEALADITASVLEVRSVNTTELANVLPRDCKKPESSYRYINRFFKSKLVRPKNILKSYIKQLLKNASPQNQTLIIQMDQTKICDGFECLMLSLRTVKRAVPLLFVVKKTKGNIPFEEQEKLLNDFYKMIPKKIKILFCADRFYGTSMLIEWCQKHNFDYRIRLKGNMKFIHEGGEITGNDAHKLGLKFLINGEFYNKEIKTNVGILQEKGHKEPWIIAMPLTSKPSKYKVLDYGLRWGIESMFSDLKTRGFRIADTHIRSEFRLENLLLVLTLALYWCVSTGMAISEKEVVFKSKKNAIAR